MPDSTPTPTSTPSPSLISACLLGEPCRYDGRAKGLPPAILDALAQQEDLIPICPEVEGGLPTPRPPAERVGERVLTQAGEDVTLAYLRGAEIALAKARAAGAKKAYLMARSPSCGVGWVYDGTFSGKLRQGNGVTAGLLEKEGIEVVAMDPRRFVVEDDTHA